jgi:NADPH:quinone reductase-like Zn-dependent oxidoreductase
MSKAVQFDSYGGIDVLEVRNVPRPVPGAGEVLVEVKAAGINPSEAVIRSGALHHLFPATFPSGQGSDFAGVVAELGPGRTRTNNVRADTTVLQVRTKDRIAALLAA